MLTMIVVLLLVVIFMITLAQFFNGGKFLYEDNTSCEKDFVGFNRVDGSDVSRATVVGVLVAAIAYFVLQHSEMLWMALLFFVVMIGIMFYLLGWWRNEGSEFKEYFVYAGLLLLVIFPIANLTGKLLAQLVANATLASIVRIIPKITLVLCLGVALYDLFKFRATVVNTVKSVDDERQVTVKENARRQDNNLAWASLILMTALILMFLFGGVAWGALGQNAKADASMQTDLVTVQADANQTQWYKFYNTELIKNGDKSDDFNFGPNPCKEGLKAEDYERIFRERIKVDPALAAADMAWLDALMGTRYLGEFYESCQHDWAKTINLTKVRFMEDQKTYYESLNAFFKFLDTASEVTIRECRGVSDQMYMNPYTSDGIPDVIVLLTDDHTGYELVYKFVIKGDVFEVAYRINCGYQPTDVAEIMGIIPQGTTPNNGQGETPPSDNGSNPPPDDEDSGENPPDDNPPPHKDDPPVNPPYNKDPSLAPKENTEPNNDLGPGPDTNNGKGANWSTEEKPSNSAHYSSYDEYKQTVDELKEINESQKTGSDPSTPSTSKPSSNTTVDDNGQAGTTTAAPINEPTSVTQPAHEAATGETISDSPGESWGGPPD